LRLDRTDYLDSLAQPTTLERHYYKQIDVRVSPWHSISMGTEQNDSLRLEFPDDPITQRLYSIYLDHGST